MLSVSTEEIFGAFSRKESNRLHQWRAAYEDGRLKIYGHESCAERDMAVDKLYGGFGIGPIRPGDTFVLRFSAK